MILDLNILPHLHLLIYKSASCILPPNNSIPRLQIILSFRNCFYKISLAIPYNIISLATNLTTELSI